jgi:pimeloyl-ACP methyl ester carboxylesterase
MKHIVLLHGAIGAADQLAPLEIAFMQKQFTVHRFIFSGHGNTPFQEQFGIEQFAGELEQFINEHSLEQPAIFGYSMGGYVALSLAKTKPALLGTIVTLGTKFAWSPEIAAKEIKMLDANTILEKVPKFAEALKARHGDEWQTLLQKTAEMMTGLGNSPALTEEDFSQLDHKILLGLADHDTMVSLDETLHVFKSLKQADLYMLPRTKHPIETVNPTLLAEIISNYLSA